MNLIEAFQEQVDGQIAALWARIREKKQAIAATLAAYDNWRTFRAAYETKFRDFQDERQKLKNQLSSLEFKIQSLNMSTTANALEDIPEPATRDPRPTSRTEARDADTDDDPATESRPTGKTFNLFKNRRGDSPTHTQPAAPQKQVTEKQQRRERKALVARPFRLMYKERSQSERHQGDESDTFNRRMQTIAEIMNDDTADEAHLLMRLPLEAVDEPLWFNPIEELGAKTETQAERLYRFMLWDSLLDTAQAHAEKLLKSAQTDALWREYTAYGESRHDEIQVYLQSLEAGKEAELETFRRQIDHLQNQITEKTRNR